MSAFASGFKMGGDMYDSAERNRLMAEQLEMDKAREARAAEKHGLEISNLRRVDDATAALLNAQQYGIQDQGAVQENRGLNMSALRRAEAGMDDSYMGAAAPASPGAGLRSEYRPAGDLDMNRLQSTLAAARGDVTGMEALRTSRKGIQYDEGLKKHYNDWNAMDDAAKSELINKLSLDQNVRGFGSWVAGKGKQAGYMNYLPPNGDPIKLSAKEAGDLYALTNLMEVDPTRARAEMDKVSDKVRAVAAQAFDAQTKGVTANNTATHYANQDANDAARTGALRNYYNRPQLGNFREFQNDKGEVVMVDVTGLKANSDGTIPIPTGLKPRTAKPEYSPKIYAETVKAFTEAGMPLPDAQMAADQHFGRGPAAGGGIDSKLQALNKNAAASKAPQIVRKGENVATDPGRPVQSPLEDFTRESERGMFGGVNYYYRDPLTNRKYSVDEYNKLLTSQ